MQHWKRINKNDFNLCISSFTQNYCVISEHFMHKSFKKLSHTSTYLNKLVKEQVNCLPKNEATVVYIL